MGFLSASKDRLIETMGPGLLNAGFLQPYGRVTDLKINSDSGELDVTLELNGEREPLRVHIQQYELLEDDGKMFFVIHRVVTSRAWLTMLAKDLAVGRRLEIPGNVARQVARFL
jgi:hypothetical protein